MRGQTRVPTAMSNVVFRLVPSDKLVVPAPAVLGLHSQDPPAYVRPTFRFNILRPRPRRLFITPFPFAR